MKKGFAVVDFSGTAIEARTDMVRPGKGDFVFVAKGFVIRVIPAEKAMQILGEFNGASG